MKLNDKTVLITGGASGIGLAMAKAFKAEGAKVIICGRTQAKLDDAVKAIGDATSIRCDVANAEDIKALVAELEAQGGIDLLVNNAGIFQEYQIAEGKMDFSHLEKEVDIDMMAPIRLIELLLPSLSKRQEAGILNVSSGLAFVPLALAPVYCASKAGLHSYTLSLRYQLREQTNLHVFELMAPLVDTPMVKDFKAKKMVPEKVAEATIKAIKRNKYQITPGISGALKNMSRLAPKFMLKQLNSSF